jgi:class 3 adenylate cyclase
MVFFNDPLPCPDAPSAPHAGDRDARRGGGACAQLEAQRSRAGVASAWPGLRHLGRIGFEDRFDYTAIGAVINLAARLCADAGDGQILTSGRLAASMAMVGVDDLGDAVT